MWLFVIATRDILANKLSASQFLKYILSTFSKVDLPDPCLEKLEVCLAQTQKNNGAYLISCVYLFFEIMMESITEQRNEGPSYTGYSVGFRLDTFKLENEECQDEKKVPVIKYYPNQIKKIQKVKIDFKEFGKLEQEQILEESQL